MERWEYQVVHLNVEAPPPAPPPPPAAPPAVESAQGAPPIRVEAVFSKEYLEKEFPGFYAPPAPGAPAREHPATQLRGFLNLQGREGWQLLGFYPVGQLQMMIFRRPLLPPTGDDPSGAPSASAAAGPERSLPTVAAEPPGAGGGSEAPRQLQPPLLERLLERLEQLERRLQALPAPPEGAASPESATAEGVATAGGGADPWAGLQDGEILPAQGWSALEGLPRLSTPEAARALGFRSAASLLNLAARSGYRQGLVKRGVLPALAVYVGSERSGRGGRERRLWVVLRAAAG